MAERLNQDTNTRELLGVGRLARQWDKNEAELGVVVADGWQGKGLGTELVRRLIEIARSEGIWRINADILSDNAAMLALAKHFHFHFVRDDDLRLVSATLTLDSPPPVA